MPVNEIDVHTSPEAAKEGYIGTAALLQLRSIEVEASYVVVERVAEDAKDESEVEVAKQEQDGREPIAGCLEVWKIRMGALAPPRGDESTWHPASQVGLGEDRLICCRQTSSCRR